MSLPRILAVVVSLIACAWFALGIRQGHDTDRATRALSHAGRLTRSQTTDISQLLDRAGALNPDENVDLLRARLQNHAGEDAAAIATLLPVVRSEPQNIDAWQLIALVAGRINPPLSRSALAHVHALAPPVRLP